MEDLLAESTPPGFSTSTSEKALKLLREAGATDASHHLLQFFAVSCVTSQTATSFIRVRQFITADDGFDHVWFN